MSRDLSQELVAIRQSVAACLARTRPSAQFRAEMILAVIRMHLIAGELEKSRDLQKLRALRLEFDRGKAALEKGVELLWRQSRVAREPEQPASPASQPPKVAAM